MYEAFIDFLNSLYWEGYAEDLQLTAPTLFDFEYSEFLKRYTF